MLTMNTTGQPPTADSRDLLHSSDLPAGFSKRNRLRRASVLIPLLKQRDTWSVLYIRRSQNTHDRHSGQVAFPGGAHDSSDVDAVDTALRETREEIGISRDNIRVVGSLNEYETISYFSVTPVVGVLSWPCTMRLQASEVARAFTIPLNWLLDETNFTLRERQSTSANESYTSKRPPVVHFKEYDGEILWGASARITLNFLHSVRTGEVLIPGYQT